jgi:hypothetical protein
MTNFYNLVKKWNLERLITQQVLAKNTLKRSGSKMQPSGTLERTPKDDEKIPEILRSKRPPAR